jgi:prepilin-type N-terminal cleavage/methylation domain-containing protein
MSKMALELFLAKDGQKGFTHRVRRSRAKVKKRTLFSSLGFTLVELLVVIAIFGLIASIVFVISRGALDSAKIAKGLQFSQHLQNSLGAYAVGIWKFDEGSGSVADDTSGWDNHGTLVNSPTWRCASVDSSYTPSGQGCSLEFDGYDDYVRILDSDALDIGNAITVEAWVKNDSSTTAGEHRITGKHNEYVLSSVRSGNSIKFAFALYNGISWSPGAGTDYIYALDTWHHVVGVYDVSSTDQLKIFINGELKNTANNTPAGSTTNPVYISWNSALFFNGLIDEVRIYSTSLSLSQIQSQYYAGLENLLAKGRISQEEYQQRLNKYETSV